MTLGRPGGHIDAYKPPAAAPGSEPRARLPMVQWARVVLAFVAIWNAATAAFGAVGLPIISMRDQALAPIDAIVMGLVVGVFYGGLSVPPYVAAWVGLRQGAKWGWALTIALGVFGLASCLPVGAFLLYAMLNAEVRQAFRD